MKFVIWAGAVTTALSASATADEAPLIIAHRGDSAHAPENTVPAIERAVEAGADWIEFDVRQTADGRLILQHDETLERFAGAKIELASLTFEEARTVDVGAWFGRRFSGERMPMLREAIEACDDCVALIEHKAGDPARYLEVLRELKAEERVVVQSFDWDFLRELRGLAPELSLGMLGSKTLTRERLDEIEALAPAVVGWKHSDLKSADVAALREAGVRVAVWTVNEPATASKFVDLGVEAVITDRPAEMRAALARR